MATFMTSEEMKKVESFKIEHKMNFEREQYNLEAEAERKGEAFTPAEYQEPNVEDILAAVRAGWKSEHDKRFERKWKIEEAHGRRRY